MVPLESRAGQQGRHARRARVAAAACLAAAWVFAAPAPLRASVVVQASLDEMLAACPLIFEGVVLDVSSESDPTGIHTWVHFRVDRRIKGAAAATLALRFRGGRVGDRREEVSGSPIPEPGERGIYFVESVDRFLVNPLYGWDQGRIRIVRAADGGDRVLTSHGHAIVAVEEPAAPSARATQALQRDGIARSTGVALGIRSDARARAEQALRAEEFEAALAARWERLR